MAEPVPAFRVAGWFGVLGAAAGFLGVAAGAFGAHALRDSLPPERLQIVETAARYQLIHALALVAVSIAITSRGSPSRALTLSGWLFVVGQILFCGSLYALGGTGVRWWGAVTPLGGAGFLAGWIALGIGLGARRPATPS
jgi:uncharacterized membrane protein YgdD (TMEM256/DUF423 family)